MKHFAPHILAVILGTALVLTVALYPTSAESIRAPESDVAVAHAEAEEPKLSEAQEAWLHDLEMCESSGNPDAVNPKDLDGTPSHGAYQFKPSTFWHYATKYDVVDRDSVVDEHDALMDRELQRAIVVQMVLHRDEIPWHREFPACVRKYGVPPA